MKTNMKEIYEEWLTAIANTRLLFNTMAELEDWLDNHSLHNNGVKRSFKSVQRMRSAFRDLKEQVRLDTDEVIDLEELLAEYSVAWHFYDKHLGVPIPKSWPTNYSCSTIPSDQQLILIAVHHKYFSKSLHKISAYPSSFLSC